MGRNLRIFSVVTQLESGGAQTMAVALHREFLQRGIASSLSFLYEKDPAVFPQRDYATYLDRKAASPLDLLRIFSRLREHWRHFAPDVVIAHTHFTNNLCAIAKATQLPGKVLAVHHNPFATFPALSRVLDRAGRSLGLYAGEVSVAEPVRQSLPAARPGLPRPVILNGQNLSTSAADKASARRSFGLPEDSFLIGNIGRLSEQKNQAFLVDLLARLPQAHVAILGEGHLRAALLEQAQRLGVSDRLTLIGAVVHERVPDFLKAVDVFAMPSLFEGMSIAMLEALAAGAPFVGSNVPALVEVMNGGAGEPAGILLPLEADRWLAEITRLYEQPDLRATLSARGIARADDFSIARMADNYLAACQQVAGA